MKEVEEVQEVKQHTAFVIMCFDSNLLIVYEKVIKTILELHGFLCVRSDEITEIGKITQQIEERISESDLIVCDLTFNNPNVFFELGIAHSLKKNIIHITQEPSNIPFDLKDKRAIPYQDSKTGLLDLRDNLSKFICKLFPNGNSHPQAGSWGILPGNIDECKEQRFALLSASEHYKHYAILYLGDSADKESFETIARMVVVEKDVDLLRDGFWALYQIDSVKAKQILLETGLRRQGEYLVRERVIMILSNYPPDQVITDQLKAQINDTSWGVRKAVCEVFGKWGTDSEEIFLRLRSMLNDENQFVRFAAKEALEKIALKNKGKVK